VERKGCLTLRAATLAAAIVTAPSAAWADPAPWTAWGFSGLVDLRLGLSDGETDWRHGGTGKLRFGSDGEGDATAHAALGDAHLLWQPRAGGFSAHIDARLQPGAGRDFGLNEGWIAWRQRGGGGPRLSLRAGLFYPPVSLENDGPGWTATRTITPSAINSWIGEEVKPVAGEARVEAPLAGGTVAAVAAIFGENDTAGALLTFRGWAMHDVTTVAGERLGLPPLSPFAASVQPRFTTPIYDLDGRSGWYGQLEWKTERLTLNAFWYDNRGDRVSLDDVSQWAWQTRFADVGVKYALDDRTEILAQGLAGRTRMGFEQDGQLWFDNDFQSVYLLVSRQVGKGALTGRVDWMHVHDRTLKAIDDNAEHGWAVTAAYNHPLADWASAMVEALHIDSDRPARAYAGEAPTARQTQVQASFRAYF